MDYKKKEMDEIFYGTYRKSGMDRNCWEFDWSVRDLTENLMPVSNEQRQAVVWSLWHILYDFKDV